jgi:hypothetical protein
VRFESPTVFGDFFITQASKEFQHDHALQVGIFDLEARQRLVNQ